MFKSQRSLSAAVFMTAMAICAPALAQLKVPDCAAMAAWATTLDTNDRWRPNQIDSRPSSVYSRLMAPDTAKLFGKPPLSWTEADIRSIDIPMNDCAQAQRKAGRDDLRRNLQSLRSHAVGELPVNYLRGLNQARQAIDAALPALERAEGSIQLLAFLASMNGVSASPQTYAAAMQRAGQVPGAAQASARSMVNALRTLPTEEIDRAAARLVARIEPMRTQVQDRIGSEIAGLPPTAAGLQQLARMRQAVSQQYASALGADRARALDQSIVARSDAIAQSLTDSIVAAISQAPGEAGSLGQIDQLAAAPLPAGALKPAQLDAIRQAADAGRVRVSAAVLKDYRGRLDALKPVDESLDEIDGKLIPLADGVPASAGELKSQLKQLAGTRRTDIVERLNRAESGSLRGRVYEGEGLSVEFVDRSRVFVKSSGQTAAGSYTEERDGRVVVSVNNLSNVFTREGRRLVDGRVVLRRVK
jgi:hypothetical protein